MQHIATDSQYKTPEAAATNRYNAAIINDMFILKYTSTRAMCTFPHMT
jgi:hypothetical protein